MKEKQLLFLSSFCDRDLYPGGPETVAKAEEVGLSNCPNLARCSVSGYLGTKHQCVMHMALEVVKNAIKEKKTIEEEMKDLEDDLKKNIPPTEGWIYSEDRIVFRENLHRKKELKKSDKLQKCSY